MSRPHIQPTGVERTFPEQQIIVSKTDKRGIITYANKLFLDIADYTLHDVIGQPHNLVRNPLMPRCVFKLLWDRIGAGKEIFAYVVNMAKNGDHYWVFAHATPSMDAQGTIVGYHSNRRAPRRDAVSLISGIYQQLLEKEKSCGSAKDALQQSEDMLMGLLKQKGTDYDRFIHTL